MDIDLAKSDFIDLKNQRVKRELKDCKLKLLEKESKANRIISEMPDFSFPFFERKFSECSKTAEDIFAFFLDKTIKLKKEGRYGTATSYQCR